MTWGIVALSALCGSLIAAIGLALTSRSPAQAAVGHAIAIMGVCVWIGFWDTALQALVGRRALLDRMRDLGLGAGGVTILVGAITGIIAVLITRAAGRVAAAGRSRGTPVSAALASAALGYSGLHAIPAPSFWYALSGIVFFAGLIGLAVHR